MNNNSDFNIRLADLDRDWANAIGKNDYELDRLKEITESLVTNYGLEVAD